ncbi:hypothetical protein RHGRI_035956 [Rhododendron griersonianum]|uniref:Uncharacterized protein n=1 Tax=Rhododendron griersonianum TaxID=479676 RepID=A0AAV6HM41_9ERIC|nr:hypothetical protein RHGRI_035956 [Rhododendron griersonianum]
MSDPQIVASEVQKDPLTCFASSIFELFHVSLSPSRVTQLLCHFPFASSIELLVQARRLQASFEVMFRSLLKRMKDTPHEQIVRMSCWVAIVGMPAKMVASYKGEWFCFHQRLNALKDASGRTGQS